MKKLCSKHYLIKKYGIKATCTIRCKKVKGAGLLKGSGNCQLVAVHKT